MLLLYCSRERYKPVTITLEAAVRGALFTLKKTQGAMPFIYCAQDSLSKTLGDMACKLLRNLWSQLAFYFDTRHNGHGITMNLVCLLHLACNYGLL